MYTLLSVILLWPSKIKNLLILMQNMFNVWELGTKWFKILFLEDRLNSKVFEKLFISYSCILFIKHCALRSICIKKFIFPDFRSIDRICLSTDWKCDKIFGYNLSSSISAWLVLDRSKLIFDWSNLTFNRFKIGQRVFKTKLFSHVLHFIQTFQKLLSSLLRPIHFKSFFVVFFLTFLKVFVFKCQ